MKILPGPGRHSRSRQTWCCGLSVLAALLVATGADARVGPPVEVQLLGPPRAAIAGADFSGEIAIRSGADATIGSIQLGGAGWRTVQIDIPAKTDLAAGEELLVRFVAHPDDPGQRLVLEFAWNGLPIRRTLDLSPQHAQRALRPARTEEVPRFLQRPFPGVDRSLPMPAPAAPDDADDDGRQELDDAKGASARSIRVQGRFVYLREDNVLIGADGLTVEIMDEDFGVDDLLGTTITDPQGYFDITVVWDQLESQPDLYVRFESVNAKVHVRTDTWYATYRWETATLEDYTGSTLNIGWVWPSETYFGAVHVLTDMVRTWRWYNARGYDLAEVDVFWPADEDVSFYTPAPYRNIHITPGRTWNESTHSHEYTHHFHYERGATQDFTYCNPGGFGDDSDGCGHKIWCRENSYVAFMEGLAEFGGAAIPTSFAASYGLAALNVTGLASLEECPEDNTYHDPHLTEGFFAAVLVDIADDTDDDHPEYPGHADQLSLDAGPILACVDTRSTTTPLTFLRALKEDNYGVREALWHTAKNCGYDIDETAPGAVTDLHPDGNHQLGVPSPDNTVTMHWERAPDDASGVKGYAVSWTAAAEMPIAFLAIDDVTTATSDELAPGTWYFNIRAMDHAGRWSTAYATCGPIVIRESEDADLVLYHHTGWDCTLVPSATADNELWDCTVSPTLPGDVAGTYWNVNGRNNGESTTSVDVLGQVGIDELPLAARNYGCLAQWQSFCTLNAGPLTVPAGRHVLHFVVDPFERIPETSEWNNDWGRQFVWTPPVLPPNTVVTRPTPGFILAGWDYVHDGSPTYFNVDGLRMPDTAWWNIFICWPGDLSEFYPVTLFHAATGAEDGFGTSLATSMRPAGCLNGIIVNEANVFPGDRDLGVSNWSPDFDGGYKAVYLQGGTAAFNMDLAHTLGDEQFFTLKEFYVSATNVGAVTLFVETEPPFAPLRVQWRDEWFARGNLLDCAAETTTGADGRAVLPFTVTETGYNSLAFWRDPCDGAAPVVVRYRLEKTPPDFQPRYATGWHSPAVPRPLYDGTAFDVPLPDTLHGDIANTYYNFTALNDSPAGAENVRVYVYLDGQSEIFVQYPSWAGDAFKTFNWSTAQTIAGGRHTFAIAIDPYEQIHEIAEDNNVYGEQYCWSPSPLGVNEVRAYVPVPPPRMGGWEQIRSGEAFWYNSHGFRLASPGTWWTGCAVMPADTTDVDIRLHPPLAGAKNGFATSLAYSSWGPGRSDYLLINHNLVPRNSMDIGVLRISGAQSYFIHRAHELYLGSNPEGVYGNYSLGAQRTLAMFEMYLSAGTWSFELQHVSGSVDWGLCLHPNDVPYLAKSTTVPGGAAWLNGVGENESITVTLTEDDYYLVAAWKAHAHGLFQTGIFNLAVTSLATPVDYAGVPAATALGPVYPNPFNPAATLAYDLAAPGTVELAIFDLKGVRVRTLVRGIRTAGRHRVVWDGCSDRGSQLASGVYVVRLLSGEVRQMRKVTLLR